MTDKELKIRIQSNIKAMGNADLSRCVLSLFSSLGYKTDRQDPFPQKTYKFFKDSFLEGDTKFNEEKALTKEWVSVDLLFQLTKNEVTDQLGLFDTTKVDNTIIETYLFFAIELSKITYSRSSLAQITREVNKVFPMPVMIIFRHGGSITLSVINRRLNRKDERKDVLEKVTVIKDISIGNPHRAHIEILFDLSFGELKRVHKFTNFVELHNAWQKTLDTKELNKRFYRELSNWYFWAIHEVIFPGASIESDKKGLFQQEEKVREHNAKNLIRLLTRILFVWFIKEKNLIPDELFDETYIKEHLINGFEPRKKSNFDHKTQGSKYYRAILQNLFFATLNQNVGKREFRKTGQHMNVTNLMRYESYFKDPKVFLNLVEEIVPFMNGGLFECLDTPNPALRGKKGGDVIIYEDGFSDRKDNSLCVPDYIFFGTGEHADLSEELGDKKQKDVTVCGLINILKSYKFTVTENTPIEEDIALDPELLGRVFENLLASYNPETKSTARKQTGSYYTPREIVEYMVDESLKAYLKEKLVSDAAMKPADAEAGLILILGYNEKENPFNTKQTAVLINAIDTCKILDPACGSGAFPMGVLHKLVHILHKLDTQNKLWKERQIEKVRAIDDITIYDQLIEDIETAFANNELDYGRKLYLIENCIYGVDIQPIATQISKLRFFISLIVDQKSDKKRENFGIRPLPNLETKFVTANTLIGIKKPEVQMRITENQEVNELEQKLKDVRHRLFSAKTPATKRKLRDEDQNLRERMGAILEDSGWSNESARQLSSWDPYDQNASSTFFDSEWMFGIADVFDIVIANPPYISIENFARTPLQIEWKKTFKTYASRGDIYCFFYEKGINLLREGGILTYISSNKFQRAGYGKNLRQFLASQKILKLIDFCELPVFSAGTDPMIIILAKAPHKEDHAFPVLVVKDESEIGELSKILQSRASQYKSNQLRLEGWSLEGGLSIDLINKIRNQGTPLIKYVDGKMYYGIKTGLNEAFVIDHDKRKQLIHEDSNSVDLIKPWIRGKDIKRWTHEFHDLYVIIVPYGFNRALKKYPAILEHLSRFEKKLKARGQCQTSRNGATEGQHHWLELDNNPSESYIEAFNEPKIVYNETSKRLHAYLDREKNAINKTGFIILTPDAPFVLAVLNSTLMDWLYRSTFPSWGDPWNSGRIQFRGNLMNQVPIPPASSAIKSHLSELSEQAIVFVTKGDTVAVKKIEQEIDKIVYSLFGISNEEISLIENSLMNTQCENSDENGNDD